MFLLKISLKILIYTQKITDSTMKYLKKYNMYIKENNIEDSLDADTEGQIYSSIEMMMRPEDDSLTLSEIIDIANENGVDEETVMWIMNRYLADRAVEFKDELKDEIEYLLKELSEDERENITWSEFKSKFDDNLLMDLVLSYTDEQIKAEFDKQTKDPNQLSLSLEGFKKYQKEDGTKVTQHVEIKKRKSFGIGDKVDYKGKEYKIHSFPEEKNKVNLRKYRKDGKLDSRDRGYYVEITDIKKI